MKRVSAIWVPHDQRIAPFITGTSNIRVSLESGVSYEDFEKVYKFNQVRSKFNKKVTL